MLFSDIARTCEEPRPYSTSEFEYLDQSARPEAIAIRRTLEQWFSRYPTPDRADLMARFKSPESSHHVSAAFELYVHELLLKLGYSIELHPQTESKKATRPDFLVRDQDGNRMYVEAVVASDLSEREQKAEARLNAFYDSMNRIEARDWFVTIDVIGRPAEPPSGRRLRKEVDSWLAQLNADSVIKKANAEGSDAFPVKLHRGNGWAVTFTAIPRDRSKPADPADRIIGAIAGEARWLGSDKVIRNVLSDKALRYGELDAPLVVAVNARVLHIDQDDVVDALFGQEQLTVSKTGSDLECRLVRRANGVWRGPDGPQRTRLSGALIGFNLKPWTFGARELALYQNPWATRPCSGKILTLPRWECVNGQMSFAAAAGVTAIFGFPEDYPRADIR